MKQKCCIEPKSQKEITDTAKLLKVIAEENRLKILCLLKVEELCVCDIWKNLGIPQNLASHHLKVLKSVELIDSKKRGLKVIYFLNKKTIENLDLSISKLLK